MYYYMALKFLTKKYLSSKYHSSKIFNNTFEIVTLVNNYYIIIFSKKFQKTD